MNHQLSYIPKQEIERILSFEIDDITRADLISVISRINTLYMINNAGSGHIGTSFSSMDLISYIFFKFKITNEKQTDLFFSSKGHDAPAIYSIMAIFELIEFDKIHSLRKLNGLPGHPDIETDGIITNTGSLGMGISKAKGFIQSSRLEGINRNVFVLLGDGELQEGQIWESLRSASNDRMGELYIIVDNNKIQSDNWVELTSHNDNLTRKFESFGCKVAEINGHDFSEIQYTFENLQHINDKPKVIIANTIKGNGVSFMHADSNIREPDYEYPYHSGALNNEEYFMALDELTLTLNLKLTDIGEKSISLKKHSKDMILNNNEMIGLIDYYSKILLDHSHNDKMIVMDGDLMKDHGLTKFKKLHPSKFIECGISEQDMVSQAGAFALENFIPIVHSFGSFLSTRANEQIYNNATEKSKIIYVSGLCGLLPAGPGHSHQSVRDIGLMGNIPNIDVFHPGSLNDLKYIFDYALNISQKSTYIRLTSIPFEKMQYMEKNDNLFYGEGYVVEEGNDIVIFSYNPYMLNESIKVAQILNKKNISAKIINFPWLNAINIDWFYHMTENIDHIFTIEDHFVFTGQGSFINSKISDKHIYNFGLNDIPVSGSSEEVLDYHNLNAKFLAEKILQKLQK